VKIAYVSIPCICRVDIDVEVEDDAQEQEIFDIAKNRLKTGIK